MGEELAKGALTIIALILALVGSAAAVGTWTALVFVFGRNVYRWLT
jgi:uncharacterized MAPEG superfamily protein